MERLGWDEYFMNIAVQVSLRSTCIRRKVGAIIVKNNNIISTGYNGAPKGMKNCIDYPDRCYRATHNIPSGQELDKCYAVHAEVNAIMNAIKSGHELMGSVMYVTTFPCSSCAKALLQAGIEKICYLDKYSDNFTLLLFNEANIKTVSMDSSIYRTPNMGGN
jgi:dCMP deaminase